MTDEKTIFVRINVKENLKREIDTVAGHEQRPVYEIMEDAWKLYKLVAIGKLPRPDKKYKAIPVVEVIAVK